MDLQNFNITKNSNTNNVQKQIVSESNDSIPSEAYASVQLEEPSPLEIFFRYV